MPAWFAPDPARDVARMGARAEQLERTVRHGKAAGNMRDLADADLAKASDGDIPVYNAATGTWRPGPGGYKVMSVLIGDIDSAPAGDGSSVIVLFTDIASTTHGTPDIVPTTPAGSWTVPAGIYTVTAEVRWDTLGGVREVRLVGGAFPTAFVPPKMVVAAAAGEPSVLTVSSGAFHSVGGDVRVIARQTSGAAGTVWGEWLSIVRLADYTYTP